VAVRAARAAAGSPALAPPLVTAAVDEAFAEPGPVPTRRTRAVVIVQDGRLVAERYGADFGPGSALPGWSMTKSVMNALTGVLARDGKLALDAPVSAPEWRAAGDPRRAVTLRQLLHMSSGLAFTETYGNPLGDVIWMLFRDGRCGRLRCAQSPSPPRRDNDGRTPAGPPIFSPARCAERWAAPRRTISSSRAARSSSPSA
jgi:CubicO group peptidase (beta-lactamase class C family)